MQQRPLKKGGASVSEAALKTSPFEKGGGTSVSEAGGF